MATRCWYIFYKAQAKAIAWLGTFQYFLFGLLETFIHIQQNPLYCIYQLRKER